MRVWKPWRCLCLGFVLQMTITFFPRLTTLQSLHNRLTDDRTFIVTHQPAHRTTPIKACTKAEIGAALKHHHYVN